MVGVPRSKGCMTCISRRVKVSQDTLLQKRFKLMIQCDELHPECSQCKRGSRECGGYVRPVKFVNIAQTKAMKSQKQRQRSQPSTTPDSTDWGSPQNRIAEMTVLDFASPRTELRSPDSELAQSLASFISQLSPGQANSGQLKLFTPWLSCIPSFLGKSTALDGAIACLSLRSMGSFSGDPNLVHESLQFYGKALLSLRRSLKSDTTALSAETLCATMVLSIYEVYNLITL